MTNPEHPDPMAPGWTSQKGYLPQAEPEGIDISDFETRLDVLETRTTWVNLGQETMPRDLVNATANPTSGTLRFTYFTARRSLTVTRARVQSGGTAAAATPTLIRWGVWGIAANGDGTLLGSIANDTSLFAATNTNYTRDFLEPFDIVRGLRYAFGLLVVSAQTMPVIPGNTTSITQDWADAPRISGQLGSQTDLPANFTGAGMGGSAQRQYALLLPAA